MSERRTLRTRGEVIEEYSRPFPQEVVETYVRPLPGQEKPAVLPAAPKKKRRVWRGILILLAVAAGLTAVVAAGGWIASRFLLPTPDEDYYGYYYEEEEEDGPITIPTAEPDPDVRLDLTERVGTSLSAPEVYDRVLDSVVTVAVELGTDSNHMSVGTGVIFREDGYILTNHHVVSGGTACTVLTADGYAYEARYIASDADYDLAILKIDETGLPAAEFLDSDTLRVGEAVYAIGTPLSLDMAGTFTDGIVSSLEREMQLTGRTSMPLIQTNAALNNGNSGGPLINSAGQVVGINFMKMYARYSTVEGLGFAIPSAQVERVVNDLLVYGELQPEPLLGISVMQLPEQLAEHLWGVEVSSGGEGAAVTPGGAADRAGIQAGDFILAIDGKEVFSSSDVLKARWKHRVGDTMEITLWRNGEIFTVTLELTDAVT